MVSCTQSYDALGLPATRTAEDGTVTTVTGDYDYMGRRIFKKVETTVADPETGESTTSVILNHRYLYRGYLQIAALDLTRTTLNALWYILWDPTEPVATRPLAIQTAGSWFAYGWDLTKNVMELYKSNGTIANSYSYAPFGEVTQRGNITNPLQWSSEMFDGELELVYYNYRHYNPHDGRWISRDPITEQEELNLYAFLGNSTQDKVDRLGLLGVSDILDIVDQTGIAQLKNVLIGLGCACMLGACIDMRNKVIIALAKGDGHKAMELDRKKTILCNYAAECARNSLGK